MSITIERCTAIEQSGWLSLRQALWPESSRAEHQSEMVSFLADPARYVHFIAYDTSGQAVGLAEASLRSEYVNGTTSSPVAFLEGLYVAPQARRQGVASELVRAVAGWGLAAGCRELASDALLDNTLSQTVHDALCFQETERVVYYRKVLREG